MSHSHSPLPARNGFLIHEILPILIIEGALSVDVALQSQFSGAFAQIAHKSQTF